MKYLLIALSVVVSGCSAVSVKDLREERPYKSEVFKADYSELGNCVLDKLMESPPSFWSSSTGNLQYESAERKKQQVMTITGSMVTHYKIPILDLVFAAKNGATVAEIRSGGIQGGPRFAGERLADDAWLFVEQCATN
jgi:hypothetical protein